MIVKPGSKLRSVVCATEVAVVRAPGGDVDLECGGHAMVPAAAPDVQGEPTPGADGGTRLGKRYADESGALEVLCIRGGAGSLAVGGAPVVMKDAKPLPASD
jgi:hypothetical protein